MRRIIIVCRTNREARHRIADERGGDIPQQQFVTVTDHGQLNHALGLSPMLHRWLDFGGSELSADDFEFLNARFTRAASLDAAIAWLRMEEKAILT